MLERHPRTTRLKKRLPPTFVFALIVKIRIVLNRLVNRIYPAYLVLFEMGQKYWLAKAIAVAAELNIADILKEESRSIDEIARITGTHAPSLYRVLRVLAGEGIFKESQGKTFALTRLARQLLEDRNTAKFLILNLAGPINWKMFGEMLYCVRTGENAAARTLGTETIFEYLKQDPKENDIYNKSMESTSESACAAIVAAYDFSKFKKIVDVGGGQGYLLSTILLGNRKLDGILFDLPHVIEGADRIFDELGMRHRVTIVSGSFFDSMPEGADAYVLKNVIHTWNDELCIRILRGIHKGIAVNGRLLLVEAVVKEDNEPSFGKLLDLQMMVATKGGRERTREEFQLLLGRAGFKLTRIVPTAAPISIIEAVKV